MLDQLICFELFTLLMLLLHRLLLFRPLKIDWRSVSEYVVWGSFFSSKYRIIRGGPFATKLAKQVGRSLARLLMAWIFSFLRIYDWDQVELLLLELRIGNDCGEVWLSALLIDGCIRDISTTCSKEKIALCFSFKLGTHRGTLDLVLGTWSLEGRFANDFGSSRYFGLICFLHEWESLFTKIELAQIRFVNTALSSQDWGQDVILARHQPVSCIAYIACHKLSVTYIHRLHLILIVGLAHLSQAISRYNLCWSVQNLRHVLIINSCCSSFLLQLHYAWIYSIDRN